MNDYWRSKKQEYFTLEQIYSAYRDFMRDKKTWIDSYSNEIQKAFIYGKIIPEYGLPVFSLRDKIVRFWTKAKNSNNRRKILRIIYQDYFHISCVAEMALAVHYALNFEDDNCDLTTGHRFDLKVTIVDRRARVANSFTGDFQELIYDVYMQSNRGIMYMTSTRSNFVRDCIVGNTLNIRATFEGFIGRENNKNLYLLKRCCLK